VEPLPPLGPRALPPIDDDNREFWTGGAEGRLMVSRCCACRRWVLPPAGHCPACGAATRPEPASGRARLLTWTLNHHPYHPEVAPPYLIAIVELVEQEDLRLATNLVGCSEDQLTAGMELEVRFEHQGEAFYPLFGPTGS
jgi:uncharacterized OB-fold protein